MKIPKSLKVGGHTYKVILPYHFKEKYDIFGQSHHPSQEIRIGTDDGNGIRRNEEGIETTFIHEILHCVDKIYNGDELFEKLGETGIEKIAEGLYQVFKDNGLLK